MPKPITIPDAVKQLLAIVALLRESYKTQKKQFTLDGRLVGDIGEVLAEEAYDIKLFEELQKHHDATSSDGQAHKVDVFDYFRFFSNFDAPVPVAEGCLFGTGGMTTCLGGAENNTDSSYPASFANPLNTLAASVP